MTLHRTRDQVCGAEALVGSGDQVLDLDGFACRRAMIFELRFSKSKATRMPPMPQARKPRSGMGPYLRKL
jgi:hypothetical protein